MSVIRSALERVLKGVGVDSTSSSSTSLFSKLPELISLRFLFRDGLMSLSLLR